MNMNQFILILFFSSFLINYSSANINTIDRQLIVHLYQEKTPKDLESTLKLEFKYNILSKDMNIWLLEFQTIIDSNILYNVRSNRNVISVSKNKAVQLRNTSPNDPKFSFQSHHLYDVTPPNTIPYGINSIGAWDFRKAGTTLLGDTIVIAIIESGMDLSHEDLDYYTNRNETPNDSIDNDSNGYIDDFRGWYATGNNGKINTQGAGIKHGMSVMGGAAAIGNNNIGVSGVAWNVKILPLSFDLNSDGRAGIIKTYDYVLNQRKAYNTSNGKKGAYIVAVNMSIGGTGSDAIEDSTWCSLYDSLGLNGILSTTACANDNFTAESLGDIPTLCQSPYMISTTALGQNLSADFSAYSTTNVDLAAPDGYFTTQANNSYGYSIRGSSTAAPLVCGAIALMYSNLDTSILKELKTKPSESILKIRDAIFNGVDITEPLKTQVKTKGKLNVFKAVQNSKSLRGYLNIIENVETIQDNVYVFENKLYITKENPLPLNLKLYDMWGREVFKSLNIRFSTLIDISFLNKGIYILQNEHEGSKKETKKIEIN